MRGVAEFVIICAARAGGGTGVIMENATKGYMEHSAIFVKNMNWHIDFFEKVFGMGIRSKSMSGDKIGQVWLYGGIQLSFKENFDGDAGGFNHLGIMVEDLDGAVAEAYRWGVSEMPQGRNWVRLPEGICIEIMQAENNAVAQALEINPRK
jgi:catechol 2,3-dioxygenase-like lactoylglutathione lyase family enzyme